MSTQTSQLVGFMDPVYNQQQQPQNFQVSPQHIQRLRHLQQQAALQHQQAGYAPHMMTMPQYHHHQQQQPPPLMQQHYEQPMNSTVESSELPSSPEEKVQTKAARRAEHNAIERARREHLNTKFQQLAHSLPNLQNDRRPSKGTIIERTLEFVKHTVQKEERYKNEIRELSRANRHLMRQVTSRSSILAGNSSVGGDDDDDDDDDVPDDMFDYEVDDGMDMITTSDDTLSRKSSCSSFAMQSLSSAPTTVGGNSSTTTSPSLDYRSMMGQWDPTQQQYHYYQQQQQHQQPSDPYMSTDGYFLANSTMDPSTMKSSMDMMNPNNLHIKYENSFPC